MARFAVGASAGLAMVSLLCGCAAAIHDVTTDMQDPPSFVDVLPLRADAANPAAYGGPDVAEAQRLSYPDITPLFLPEPPGKAYARALALVKARGWTLVGQDLTAGRIEATAETPLMHFKDDVVLRIRARGDGCRVDMRSVSRIGQGDMGTNARRIREFLADLRGPKPQP